MAISCLGVTIQRHRAISCLGVTIQRHTANSCFVTDMGLYLYYYLYIESGDACRVTSEA